MAKAFYVWHCVRQRRVTAAAGRNQATRRWHTHVRTYERGAIRSPYNQSVIRKIG